MGDVLFTTRLVRSPVAERVHKYLQEQARKIKYPRKACDLRLRIEGLKSRGWIVSRGSEIAYLNQTLDQTNLTKADRNYADRRLTKLFTNR